VREKSVVIYFNLLSLSMGTLKHHVYEMEYDLEASGLRMLAGNRLHGNVHELYSKYAQERYHLIMH
jgi:hypothetical protein